jgi:glucose dehydrogenase
VISRIGSLAVVTLLLVGCLPALRGDSIPRGEWPNYGNDAGGTRYSPLTQIDRENVARLRVAWTYRTGETVGVPSPWAHDAFEATPLMVDGTLFFSTPYNRVIALDAETGKERWAWDAKVDRTRRVVLATSRGVSTCSTSRLAPTPGVAVASSSAPSTPGSSPSMRRPGCRARTSVAPARSICPRGDRRRRSQRSGDEDGRTHPRVRPAVTRPMIKE